ncbi:hypothetical protein PGN35_020280 [Nodosilinea sp. PGN35]|uniref:hypothetical protein n=1 Tax=Nodosilinea sp. PGN35 TaxID=3020489 RepID=UPI0023B29109|nr:hypothetical protein [Nodosilinea sp. TSF1-S3]MDF0369784.1 hypothetical protein [Nodosilinea sp. TSF1-S3]
MTDLLSLADAERTLVNWLVRQRGASFSDLVAHTQLAPATLEATLNELLAAGFLTLDEAAEPPRFKPNLISRKPRTVPDPLWRALD